MTKSHCFENLQIWVMKTIWKIFFDRPTDFMRPLYNRNHKCIYLLSQTGSETSTPALDERASGFSLLTVQVISRAFRFALCCTVCFETSNKTAAIFLWINQMNCICPTRCSQNIMNIALLYSTELVQFASI